MATQIKIGIYFVDGLHAIQVAECTLYVNGSSLPLASFCCIYCGHAVSRLATGTKLRTEYRTLSPSDQSEREFAHWSLSLSRLAVLERTVDQHCTRTFGCEVLDQNRHARIIVSDLNRQLLDSRFSDFAICLCTNLDSDQEESDWVQPLQFFQLYQLHQLHQQLQLL